MKKQLRLASVIIIVAVTSAIVGCTQNKHSGPGAKYGIETVKIPAGTFTMGSPTSEADRCTNETQHQVTLTKPFYMSKYLITNKQYADFLNAKGIGSDGKSDVTYHKYNLTTTVTENQTLIYACSSFYHWGLRYSSGSWQPVNGYDNFPIIYVTWYGAKAYADWVGGTLPTEAQWEYACRAGTTTPFSVGTAGTGNIMNGHLANIGGEFTYDADKGGEQNDKPSGIYLEETTAVGQYAPNAWGLYDMHGNTWEWCSDWYDHSDANAGHAATDPKGASTGIGRIVRGGSWRDNAKDCRSACRPNTYPDYFNPDIGFRVVFIP